jgi:hypothetical protein
MLTIGPAIRGPIVSIWIQAGHPGQRGAFRGS